MLNNFALPWLDELLRTLASKISPEATAFDASAFVGGIDDSSVFGDEAVGTELHGEIQKASNASSAAGQRH